ncbi:MAG: hypothetical protein DRP47_08060 [Candidatus Zixiibacteriota bacterium]|nr:MAG: hypothetical protein DRP47_08060 [candidate division Zixibacteria bacterium]
MTPEQNRMDNQTSKSQPTNPDINSILKTVPLTRNILTFNRTLILSVVGISIIFGIGLPFIEYKFQFILLALFPAAVGALIMVLNPHLGVIAFFFYDYMRLESFIPALRPMHLAILIEATTLFSWVIYLIINRQGIKWHNLNWGYLGFVVVIATTVLTATNNRNAYDVFIVLVVWFIIFLIGTNVINSLKRLNTIIMVLLLVHLYFAIKAILTGGFVGGSLMGDENDLALAMNVFIPFAYFFLMGAKKPSAKIFYLVILIACVSAVIVSLSRGGTVGLVAVVLFCIMKSKRRIIGFSLVLMLGLGVIFFAPDEYWNDMQTISDTSESTAQTRINYWKASVRMFIDYPVTGVGADNGGIRMPEYIKGFRDANTQWGRTFHGTFPQVLAELGTLGMGCYLFMIYLALTGLLKIQKRKFLENQETIHKIANSIMGGIVAFLVTGTFLSTAYYPQLWTMFLFSVALFHITQAQSARESSNNDRLVETG